MFFFMNKREKALKLIEAALAPHVKAVELFHGKLESSDFLDPYVLGYVVGQLQYATHAVYRGRATVEQKGMVALEVWKRLLGVDPKVANLRLNELTANRDGDFALGLDHSGTYVDVMLGLRTAVEDPVVANALAESKALELENRMKGSSKDGPAAAGVLASRWIGERLKTLVQKRAGLGG